ncbi:HAD family hydrolase [Croceicoccus ponticola]|uniref:Phosphoglycolate phosphatase n=1 Tax=Croceicoccus ponticola TaxID=2217664 RepID=A0A437GWW5_9SPHN|nr:HAD-IA family hydrolase [Croceicoccus ponticola]RVQ66893.1 HAD family hydrolase [Croceicoccus ponticola]
MQDLSRPSSAPVPAPHPANPARALRFHAVGFDLDGTLLETAPDIANALNHALRMAGRPTIAFEQVRPMIGGGAKRLLAKALAGDGKERVPAETLDPLYAELLSHYEANIAVETKAYDGLMPALDQLAEAGIAVGVATNKLESLARHLLDQMGMLDRFACVIGGDTLGTQNAKPKPDMLFELQRQCGGGPAAFVGDSIYDTGAARAAGHPCVAVSFGYRTQPVTELGADAVIDHFDELIPALSML